MDQGSERLLRAQWGAEGRQARAEAVIEKLARAIKARRLEGPAALFLELNRPLGFLMSQVTLFARPFLAVFVPAGEVEAAAEVLDDPEAMERLLERLAEGSDG